VCDIVIECAHSGGSQHRDIEQAPGDQHPDQRGQRGETRGGQAPGPQPGGIRRLPSLAGPVPALDVGGYRHGRSSVAGAVCPGELGPVPGGLPSSVEGDPDLEVTMAGSDRKKEGTMCRWLAYSGSPILLEELLYKPPYSPITPSMHARMGATTTNGDGFGVGWYAAGDTPGVF